MPGGTLQHLKGPPDSLLQLHLEFCYALLQLKTWPQRQTMAADTIMSFDILWTLAVLRCG